MILKFKDFLNEKKAIDLHIDTRNNLKLHIQRSVLKSYEISNNLIKLTFFNDDVVELPLKLSDDGKYLVIDGSLWDYIVKYQEMLKTLKDTEFFQHEGKKYPFSKIHDLISTGESEWYNRLCEDFGLQSISTNQEIKNGTITFWYTKPEIAITKYVPRNKPIFKITKSGNVYIVGDKRTFLSLRYLNSLEDYDHAFEMLYNALFKKYMLALKKWEKENKNDDIALANPPEEITHAKRLKYPTLKGLIKTGLF